MAVLLLWSGVDHDQDPPALEHGGQSVAYTC